MHAFMHLLIDVFIGKLTRAVGVAMVLAILVQVFSRMLLKVPYPWTDEVARVTFIWFCLLGAVLGLRQHAHLGIDYFRSKLAPRGRWLSDIVVAVCVIIFGAFALWYGVELLGVVGRQRSPVMRVSMYWFYLIAPLTGAAFFLQGIEFLIAYLKSGKARDAQ